MEKRSEVLVVDHESAWRDQLCEGLRTDGLEVRCTDLTPELVQTLIHPPATVSGIVLGHSASGGSAIDALFEASSTITKGPPERPALFLITDVRKDEELLKLLLRRGVSEFLHRDSPIENSVGTVRARLFAKLRANPRKPVSVSCVLTFGQTQVSGTVEDVSVGGARCIFRARKLKRTPEVGEALLLTVNTARSTFDQQAEARSVNVRRSLLGDTLVVGLKFTHPREAVHETVDQVAEGNSFGFPGW